MRINKYLLLNKLKILVKKIFKLDKKIRKIQK